MRTIVTIGALLLLLNVVLCASPWSSCGSPSDPTTISSVTLNPDPPQRTKNDNVTLTGTLNVAVTGGTVDLVITYLGIPVYSQKNDICKIVSCPLAPGQLSASLLVPGSAIPVFSPPGSYIGTSHMIDSNNKELACVQVTFVLP